MQVRRSPTARCTSTAATELSTPPERPQITRRVGAHQLADARDLALDEVPRRPVGRAAADLEEEVVEDLTAAWRVRHLGVELDPEERQLGVLDGRDGGVVAARGHLVARRRGVDVVAVAHPDRRLLAAAESAEQPSALDRDARPAVLPAIGPGHPAAGEMGQQLHAVAEAQHRRAEAQQLRVGGGHALAIDRVGPARQDDPLGLPVPDPRHGARGRMDLAVDVGFAHPARDELGVLRAEIDDQDAVVVGCHSRSCSSSGCHRVARSVWYSSSSRSRGRETHQRPSSTITSAGRGRVL